MIIFLRINGRTLLRPGVSSLEYKKNRNPHKNILNINIAFCDNKYRSTVQRNLKNSFREDVYEDIQFVRVYRNTSQKY